jgi:putative transposase
MPRPPRLEYEDALYHVTSRGNGKQVIFRGDRDRERFLEQLADCIGQCDVLLRAYVLMDNHYHLLVQTPRGNLSRFMQRLNTSYALYARYKHGKPGHLFQGRYHARLVDGDEYAVRLTRYIHLNPVKVDHAGKHDKESLLRRLETYRWSSYPGYVDERRAKDVVDYRILKLFGRNEKEARERYRIYVREMLLGTDDTLAEAFRASEHVVGEEGQRNTVHRTLRQRGTGRVQDQDVKIPKEGVGLDLIDGAVASKFGIGTSKLKEHGHRVGAAKVVAVELASRLSGMRLRDIGLHYGLSPSGVTAVRKKAARLPSPAQKSIAKLLREFSIDNEK